MKNIKNLDKGSYLAGLWEGDGHISIAPDVPGKKAYNPRFNITFNEKDEKLALLIKSWVNDYGFIRYKVREHAVVYTVSNIEGLLIVINLINGKLRSPKIVQFKALIEYLNKHKSLKIEQKPIDNSPLSENSWLAGLSDADSCFDIRYTEGEKLRIAVRMRIDQRKSDPVTGESYKPLFEKISQFFETTLGEGEKYLNMTASSVKSIKVILSYFERHTLISSKYLNYKDWEIVANYVINKEQYIKKEEVKKIKSGMNSLRTIYNWEHLNNIRYK